MTRTGTLAMVTASNRMTPYLARFDGQTWRDVCGGFCVDTPVTMHPVVVIDPEDREAIERLVNLFDERVDGGYEWVPSMQAALRELADPKPVEVFEHFVVPRGARRALCGKVWVSFDDTVSAGKCPDCLSIIEAGWTK